VERRKGVRPGDLASEAVDRQRRTDALIGRTNRSGDPREGHGREEVGGEHPCNSWSHFVVETPRISHAPPQYPTKRWLDEARMERWFPLTRGEHACWQLAEAAERRATWTDRSRRAPPDDPPAELPPSKTRGNTPPRPSSVTRRIDAGRQAVPASGEVSLDIPLYGKPPCGEVARCPRDWRMGS
jgi:hypothetical protein